MPAKSPIKKFSICLNAHKTSLSLEPVFWRILKLIAEDNGNIALARIVEDVDRKRGDSNLSSALRIFCLNYTMDAQVKQRLRAMAQDGE